MHSREHPGNDFDNLAISLKPVRTKQPSDAGSMPAGINCDDPRSDLLILPSWANQQDRRKRLCLQSISPLLETMSDYSIPLNNYHLTNFSGQLVVCIVAASILSVACDSSLFTYHDYKCLSLNPAGASTAESPQSWLAYSMASRICKQMIMVCPSSFAPLQNLCKPFVSVFTTRPMTPLKLRLDELEAPQTPHHFVKILTILRDFAQTDVEDGVWETAKSVISANRHCQVYIDWIPQPRVA